MNNAVNMLAAINQSLSTSSSQVSLTVNTDTNEEVIYRIPSFLYLENKLEQLDNNFGALFDMPESGQAWFQRSQDMYKLKLVRSNTSPVIPQVDTNSIYGFNIKDNTFVKDLVNPKTYVKLNISNLPDNIHKMYMKKLVIFDSSLVPILSELKTYDDYKAALYNKTRGVDYDEYDSELSLPIKKDTYKSEFKILDIAEGPWTDEESRRLRYKIRLDTLSYTDEEDSSISYSLKTGDILTLSKEYATYEVKEVYDQYNSDNTDDTNEKVVILEEHIGHIRLHNYDDNSEMVLYIYNENYNNYHYVEIPLEENPYIAIFLGTIDNGVRSILSDATFLDLNSLMLIDDSNNLITDSGKGSISYIEYYRKYCKNIGDLILGLSEVMHPQLTNFNNAQLAKLTNSSELQKLVTSTLYKNNASVLSVSRINSHLIDDATSENIISLHQQKSEINSQLATVQSNIDQIYNQLVTTDFTQEKTLTQESLRSQLDNYYKERLALQKQSISIVDNINSLQGEAHGVGDAKFRVRGVTDSTDTNDSEIESSIISYLHDNIDINCDIIGLDVEYKYRSINKDTTSVTNVNNVIFTDWNKMSNIDRQRYIEFDQVTGAYKIKYVSYNGSNNIIKWNQIDIPINQGEDVVVRVRYKVNIGQPFINIYTPWSDETTVTFPTELTETIELSSVLAQNQNDTINAHFINTLISEGYQDHVSNKLIDNSQIFYHMPENIYSGFNTPNNNLISLKDKLLEMTREIEEYKAMVENQVNANYSVYIEYDNNTLELTSNAENNIVISEPSSTMFNSFIRKDMKLIVKNTGSVPINLYSIFPGNTDIPLLCVDKEFYNQNIVNYERVPLVSASGKYINDSIIPQTMGQWIYFRQNSAWTKEDFYLNLEDQRSSDIETESTMIQMKDNGEEISTSLEYNGLTYDGADYPSYIKKDRSQALLGFRKRTYTNNDGTMTLRVLKANGENILATQSTLDYSKLNSIKYYLYKNGEQDATSEHSSNMFVLKYEHIHSLSDKPVYLSNDISQLNLDDTFYELYGSFLIPELLSSSQVKCDIFEKSQYKRLEPNQILAIPIVFEYMLNADKHTETTQTISFDLRPTLMNDPDNYILNVTAIYNKASINRDVKNAVKFNDTLVE